MPSLLLHGHNHERCLKRSASVCFIIMEYVEGNPLNRVTPPGVPHRRGYGAAVTRLVRHGAAVAVMTNHYSCTAMCTVSSFIIKIYKCGIIKFSYSDAANPFSFPILAHESKRGAASQSQRCSWRCSECSSATAGEAASARLLQLECSTSQR